MPVDTIDHHTERSARDMPTLDRGVHVAFMRHGEPYRPAEVPTDPAQQAQLGLLTEPGREATRRATVDLLERVSSEVNPDTPVVACFLGSPSPLVMGHRPYGARGMDTATVAREAASSVLPSGRQVEVHEFRGATARPVRPHEALAEANYYYAPGRVEPERYVGALAARAAQLGVGKQDVWLQTPADLEPIREGMSLESPAQAAERLTRLTEQLNSHSRQVRAVATAEGRPAPEVVYVAASHGDTIKALLQEKFGDEPGASEALQNAWYGDKGYNGVVVLSGDQQGRARLEFAHAE